MHISQIDLFVAIMTHLEKKAECKTMTQRQMNAIINAANLIVDVMKEPYKAATPDMGLAAWLDCDETGLSSKYMAGVIHRHFSGRLVFGGREPHYPRDPGDFARCVGMLTAMPDYRPHIHLLASGHGPQWAALIANWDRLESLYREEAPNGNAPKLFAEMERLLQGDVTG